MAAMRRLVGGLTTNDTEMIQSSLDDLHKGNEQLSTMRAEVGGRMAQINKMIDSSEVNRIQGLDAISKVEDVDAAKAFPISPGSDRTQSRGFHDSENNQRTSHRHAFRVEFLIHAIFTV